jgi:hypothetical protein
MNIESIKSEFEKSGWKNVGPGSHLNVVFDLIGSRRFTITKWNILVKVLPMLDQAEAAVWKANFEELSRRSKSLIWGKCFILCLVAEDVAPEISGALSGDAFGLFGLLRLKGGGGNILVADMKNKQVYGKVPAVPIDVHKYSKKAKEILVQTIGEAGSLS